MRLPFALFLTRRHRLPFAVCVAGLALGAACGIGLRRDLATIPPGRVGFDDMCGLQDYFDTIEAKLAEPPPLVSAVDMENQSDTRIQGGKNRFSFETEFQLKNLRRVLDENWRSLPEPLAKAERVDIEVHWSAKAGVRRVVTDGDAELIIGRESFALPYQVCLSELLFGAPLYQQRRLMAGRMLPYRPILGDSTKTSGPDAGMATATAPAVAPATPAAMTTPAASAWAAPAPPAAAPASAPTLATPAPAPPARPAPATSGSAAAAPAPPVFKAAPPAQ